MTDRYLDYLSREHARLEEEIRQESKRPWPDDVLIARLKKMKLAVKDQMQSHIQSCNADDRLIA
jgi:hypothetical protein